MRAGGAIRPDFHFVLYDFARQSFNMLKRAGAGTGQTEIERIDTKFLHQVEDHNFFLDRRIAYGGRLQAVAQAFVVEQHRARRLERCRMHLVPIVDELGGLHAICQWRSGRLGSPTRAEPGGSPLVLHIRSEILNSNLQITLTLTAQGDLSFRGQRQSKHRDLPLPGNIHPAQIFRVGQVQSLAIFAAIDLGILTPGLLYVATSLLDNVCHVVPALEMAAAELAFVILLIAGALADFLNLYFMMRELLGSLYHFGCGQRTHPRPRPEPPDSAPFILTEGMEQSQIRRLDTGST